MKNFKFATNKRNLLVIGIAFLLIAIAVLAIVYNMSQLRENKKNTNTSSSSSSFSSTSSQSYSELPDGLYNGDSSTPKAPGGTTVPIPTKGG